MANYPPAVYHLDNDETTIRDLIFECKPHRTNPKSRWISPQVHNGVLTLHTKLHPLVINYIADDRKSLLVRLDDPLLHSILVEVEAKVKAASPAPVTTQTLINYDTSERYPDSLKLKCAFTKWIDANTGEEIDVGAALSSKRNRITSWVLQVYRLNEYKGKWYFAIMLHSAKVSRAAEESELGGKRKREEDLTQYL